MRRGDLDRFLLVLSKRVQKPMKIYLTGGVAAWILGGVRPTEDVDFGVECGQEWCEVEKGIGDVSREVGVPVEFSEDISRWGLVGFSNFKKGARLYRRYGSLKVYVLDPVIWSVGKLNRYLASDIDDVIHVFKKNKPPFLKVLRIWGEALKQSPKSTGHLLFVRHVEDFLKTLGGKVWGRKFDAGKAIVQFEKFAGIKREKA